MIFMRDVLRLLNPQQTSDVQYDRLGLRHIIAHE